MTTTPSALRLAAFADEISPNLDEQIAVCRECGVSHFELRGVAGQNVLDFDPALRRDIKTKLADNGLAVAAIGSPIGKVKLADPWPAHFDRFKIAVELAEYFNAPLIRLFSYYETTPADRDEVLRRFQAKLDYLRGRPITLVHENEARIYGEHGRECLDLLQSLNHPQLRAAFDFANFVQCGEDPLDNWPALKPYTAHIHIKDARRATGEVVPAGHGDGHLEPILQDAWTSGYRGFLSLEPHLAPRGPYEGKTKPDLFRIAVRALRDLAAKAGIPLAT